MNVVLFGDTRSGSTCVGKWIADSANLPYCHEWVGEKFKNLSLEKMLDVSATREADYIKDILRSQRAEYKVGSVMKLMYHDFGFGTFEQSVFGPFSRLLQAVASEPNIAIHLVRKDFMASAISSWYANRSGRYHAGAGVELDGFTFVNSLNSTPIAVDAPTQQDIKEILGEYERRLLSFWAATICLRYYFGSRLVELTFEDFQGASYRDDFVTRNFQNCKSAALSLVPVGTPTDVIRGLISQQEISGINAKIGTLLEFGRALFGDNSVGVDRKQRHL